jgi:hypothetical protein
MLGIKDIKSLTVASPKDLARSLQLKQKIVKKWITEAKSLKKK